MALSKQINLPLPDAALIRGVPVSEATPSNAQVLTYNSTTGQWEPAASTGGTGGTVSGGGDPNPQYLTLAATGSLANERVFTPGTGLGATDGGAGSSYTLGINNNVVATVSGTRFTGAVLATAGLSGSLQLTTAGLSYLVAIGGISIVTQSNGQIFISASASPNLTPYAQLAGATFTGPVIFSTAGGATGSITQLIGGAPFITAPANNVVTITTGSNGQIIISGSGAGGSGAPTTAQYLTLATDATLTSERVFTPSSGLSATDGGANGSYTLAINNNVVATLTGSTFSGPVLAGGGLSGSLQKLTNGASYLVQVGGITITSQSSGQVFISSSVYTTPLALQDLTQSISYATAGAGTLSILHSGSVITTFDALFRVHDLKARWQTTSAGTSTGLQFISGANGRTYAVDALLQAMNTTTTESGRWKLSMHARMASGAMVLVASDTSLSSSSTAALSGTLSLSGANIILQSTAPSGTWNWGASMRVQELG